MTANKKSDRNPDKTWRQLRAGWFAKATMLAFQRALTNSVSPREGSNPNSEAVRLFSPLQFKRCNSGIKSVVLQTNCCSGTALVFRIISLPSHFQLYIYKQKKWQEKMRCDYPVSNFCNVCLLKENNDCREESWIKAAFNDLLHGLLSSICTVTIYRKKDVFCLYLTIRELHLSSSRTQSVFFQLLSEIKPKNKILYQNPLDYPKASAVKKYN